MHRSYGDHGKRFADTHRSYGDHGKLFADMLRSYGDHDHHLRVVCDLSRLHVMLRSGYIADACRGYWEM